MSKSLALFLFALLAVFAACGPATRPACADPVRLVLWGVESSAESKDMDARIAVFEQRHPNIYVSALSMGAGGMNPQKLMTAIVGKVPPDLVYQDRFTVGDWASRGAFRPLDDLLAADAHSKSPLAVRQSDYVPATWAETLYQNHVYAIPNDTDDRVLYYNKALFKQAGLAPPQTWDEMIAAAKKLTVRNTDGSYERAGLLPGYGEGWLYMWSWQEDGEVMSADGRRCTLANPQTTKALTSVVSWYDALGGVDALSVFQAGFGSEEHDPFLIGKLAMLVAGDGYMNTIARYNPSLDFGVVPVPVPKERLHHEGRFRHDPTWVTWSGGHSFVIPRGAKHVPEAWQFIQWVNSPEAAMIGARAQAGYQRNKGRLFVPSLSANVKASQEVFGTYLGSLPPAYAQAKTLCRSLLVDTKFRPVTFVGQLLWDQQSRAVDSALRHRNSPLGALTDAQRNVQIALDAIDNEHTHPLLPTGRVVAALVILILVGLLVLGIALARWRKQRRPSEVAEAGAGFLFALPWIFGFLVFTFGPVLASLVLSFCDYDVLHPPRWAGVSNYLSLATLDRPLVLKSLENVLYLSVFGIPLGMLTSLSMALLLNTKVRGQQMYRTAFYVPSIVPLVASTVLWAFILNPDPHRGLINAGWHATLTAWFGIAPPGWEGVPLWAKPGLILMGLWGAGGGIILWLAGLQAIPSTLYEAASLDGAGAWSQFRNVTLPMLSPYIFFNLIMGTIGALQTFETAYILGNTAAGGGAGPDDSLLVPVLYLFNNAFQYFKMGYASALAWLLFLIILGLTLGQLKLAPRWVHKE